MIKALARITLRNSILDPQGKATHHALDALGFEAIRNVRIGKYIELLIDSEDPAVAKSVAEEACRKLLANPVTEDFEVTLSSEEFAT